MLKFALVGCGRIAQRHAQLLAGGHIAGASLAAVSDVLPERAAAFGKEYGVPHFALPDLPAYAHLGGRGRFSMASAFATEILSLPMFAELTEAQIDHVAQSIRRAVA